MLQNSRPAVLKRVKVMKERERQGNCHRLEETNWIQYEIILKQKKEIRKKLVKFKWGLSRSQQYCMSISFDVLISVLWLWKTVKFREAVTRECELWLLFNFPVNLKLLQHKKCKFSCGCFICDFFNVISNSRNLSGHLWSLALLRQTCSCFSINPKNQEQKRKLMFPVEIITLNRS